MIKTAVVILNWNGIGWLQKFLETVVRFSKGPETALYLADNGSTDGSADWVEKNFSDINIIRFESNYGFAEGYNLALKQIDARYFVLLNSDAEVTKGWLDPMIKHLDQNPIVAACQPKIRSYLKRDHFEYAGAAGGFIDKFGYTFCRGRIFETVEKDIGQYDDETDIFWASGACMTVRSEAWVKCGGFDGNFFAHMEEVDLCWRFHLSGFRVSYIPGSTVYHAGGGVLPYESSFKTYLNFRNNLYLLYKNLPGDKLLGTIFIRKLLDGVAAIMFLLKGRPGNAKAVWKAHIDYYRNLKLLKTGRRSARNLSINISKGLILNKSIVFRFYIRGQKTFRSLNI